MPVWRMFSRIVAILGAIVILVVFGFTNWGDSALYPIAPGPSSTEVEVVDYGYHAGLFIPRERLAEAARVVGASRSLAVATRFAAYDVVELGWGDAGFYRYVPAVEDVTVSLAARAMLGLNEGSVVHVVGRGRLPQDADRGVRLWLSDAGLRRLVRGLEATLSGEAQPVEMGPGLYGPSLFYASNDRYSLINDCNHWIAGLLNSAGVTVNMLLATHSRPLIWQLRFGLPRSVR